jgi:hypothetical protein
LSPTLLSFFEKHPNPANELPCHFDWVTVTKSPQRGSAPSLTWRWKMTHREHSQSGRLEQKQTEGNLGQKETRLEKDKKSELSNMGETPKESGSTNKGKGLKG